MSTKGEEETKWRSGTESESTCHHSHHSGFERWMEKERVQIKTESCTHCNILYVYPLCVQFSDLLKHLWVFCVSDTYSAPHLPLFICLFSYVVIASCSMYPSFYLLIRFTQFLVLFGHFLFVFCLEPNDPNLQACCPQHGMRKKLFSVSRMPLEEE